MTHSIPDLFPENVYEISSSLFASSLLPWHLTPAVSRRPHPQTPAWEQAAAGGGRLQCVVRGWQGPPLGPV